MGAEDEELEQTLIVCREAALYKIAPRTSGGHRSGDWLVSDRIFAGRVRVIAKGQLAEVRIEDPNSGDLFAMCPVAPGQRPMAVEPVTDSSRGFVLRLVDPTSGRHAFIGLMFGDRNEAFDFNVALSDHEKHLQREREVAAARGDGGGGSGAAEASPDVAALYRRQDLSLKDGETLKIHMKAPAARSEAGSRGGGDFLAQLGEGGRGQDGAAAPPPAPGGGLLAPPPQAPPAAGQRHGSAPAPAGVGGGSAAHAPPAAPARGGQQRDPGHGGGDPGQGRGGAEQDLLGQGAPTTVAAVAGAAEALEGYQPFGAKSSTTATTTDSWATFE